jgi:DNA polymerase-1
VDGVEADDVIGTLSREAAAREMKVIISTGDKDLAQLVGPHVLWVNTMSNEKLDEAGVLAKFGVPVDKLIDYFSLLGDAIDNIPGVDKVGPKTAAKWITQYGSLDGVIENAAKFTGQAGDNLRKAIDWLPTGRRLLTVKCDCELPLRLDDLNCGQRDDAKLAQLFDRLGFRTWLKEVQSGKGAITSGEENFTPGSRVATRAEAKAEDSPERPAAKPLAERNYELVVDEAALEAWAQRLEPFLAAGNDCYDFVRHDEHGESAVRAQRLRDILSR